MAKLDKVCKLVGSVMACELAGMFGALFTMPSISTWYSTLNKPSFTPPNWLFGPVWVTLYLLMGISLYLVWEKGLVKSRMAYTFFSLQLLFNAFWTIIFFGLEMPSLAFIEIIILWFLVAATTYQFYKISKPASVLLIPYLVWLTIAAALNYSVMILN